MIKEVHAGMFGNSSSRRIQRAAHRQPAPVQNMRVDLGRRHVAVSEQLLHRDQRPVEFEILNSQSQCFHQPHPRTIEQGSDQPLRTAQLCQYPLDFTLGENDRQTPGSTSTAKPRSPSGRSRTLSYRNASALSA